MDPTTLSLTCVQHPTIDAVPAEWDALVPRDLPHLRTGFLRAVERSGMNRNPAYLLTYHDNRLVAVALAYTVLVRADPERPLRVCGSAVGNGENGICFAADLSLEQRRQVFRRIVDEVVDGSPLEEPLFFKDFTQEAISEYAGELEAQGFFTVDPGPGTQLVIRWDSFDDYLNAMQKRYRRRIRGDLKTAAAELEFSLLDSFTELAPRTTVLYNNVLARQPFSLQQIPEAFFAGVSDFEQAKLLVARHRPTGELLGINLLLFGESCMQNLYVGFDYDTNEQHHTYFNLVEHSIRLAIEHKCKVCYLGQASYEFKARLGAVPFPLTAYMKHRSPDRHAELFAIRDFMFPKSEVATHDVFRAGSEEGE